MEISKINREEYEILKGLDGNLKMLGRNSYGWLVATRENPIKVEDTWDHVEYKKTFTQHQDSLFQFINWEDEEPYNIQELIEEYEDEEYGYFNMKLSREYEQFIEESEETEVKKDLEWLKNEIDERIEKYEQIANDTPGNAFTKITAVTISSIYEYVKDLIDQLEESEITTEQAWDVIEGAYGDEVLQNNIDYVESQGYTVLEKPTIPQFVAEYIKDNKGRLNVHGGLVDVQSTQEGKVWEWVFYNHNQDEFAEAWLAYPNVEVEEEQKYYVNILDEGTGAYLIYYPKTGNYGVTGILDDNKGITRFTEQEIKDYDERFWAFAVPVEEEEE